MFKQMGKAGGLGGKLAQRGMMKRKKQQLKDMKADGNFPMDFGGLAGGSVGGVRGRKKKKKKKKRK